MKNRENLMPVSIDSIDANNFKEHYPDLDDFY